MTLWRGMALLTTALALIAFIAPGARAATTFTVNTVDDLSDGSCDSIHCNLREAITAANGSAGADDIHFDIFGPGPHSIAPLSQLPAVSDPAVVDGSTEPDYAGSPVVELNGSLAGSVDGLTISGGGSTVKALAINRFVGLGNAGVRITSDGNVIEGSYVGTDVTGQLDQGNFHGVWVQGSGNAVGGSARNVTSGNNGNGVTIRGDENVVRNTFVGTDVDGSEPLANGQVGISILPLPSISSIGNVVGGTSPGDRNVISGNLDSGVRVSGANASANRVEGNLIGTDAQGEFAIPNPTGVHVTGQAHDNVIGGDTPGARNVISGNQFEAGGSNVAVGSTRNRVQGNYIGTDAGGTDAIGGWDGVTISGLSASENVVIDNLISGNVNGVLVQAPDNVIQSNLIGTDATGQAALSNNSGAIFEVHGGNALLHNVISGNSGEGVRMVRSSGNRVAGNWIGVAEDGSSPLPNGLHGIRLTLEASDNDIGEGEVLNVIAFNGADGIHVESGVRNRINAQNAIYENGGLGIDLGPNGVTPNDPGDGDSGANELQNFPVLTSASESGGGADVSGTLDSKPDTEYQLLFYENDACDPSGHGEGQRPLQFELVTTDASGTAAFTVHLSGYTGGALTATATDPDGNTSEFSNCLAVTPASGECSDEVDNDGDGRVDHPADRQCESPSDPSERSQCSDELDNDGDGEVDYPADPGCQSARDNSEGPNPQCSDGVDNDGDGRTDYPADPGCQGVRDNSEGSNPQCSDGLDNDGDGAVDHPTDRGCRSPRDDNEADAECGDGVDNDGDGRTDYPDDPGCRSATDAAEGPDPECGDGVDNDGDGRTDHPDDPGCASIRDNSEAPDPECGDRIDNDGDGRTDYPDDAGCRSSRDNSEGSEGVP